MSKYRYAAKSDQTQPDIVKELERVGIQVWIIRHPVDLLLRFWCSRHREWCWQPLEIKTPNRKDGSYRTRKDQNEQTQFLIETQTPVATSFVEAIGKLNQRHHVGVVL